MKNLKKFLSLLLVLLFTAGVLPLDFGKSNPAEAKVKKAYRKAKAKKVKKAVKKAKKTKRPAQKIRSGIITQIYALEEGVDEAEAGNIIEELKDLGAEDTNVNIDKNLLLVKFNPQKLSAVKIIQRLKELGYTIKRID